MSERAEDAEQEKEEDTEEVDQPQAEEDQVHAVFQTPFPEHYATNEVAWCSNNEHQWVNAAGDRCLDDMQGVRADDIIRSVIFYGFFFHNGRTIALCTGVVNPRAAGTGVSTGGIESGWQRNDREIHQNDLTTLFLQHIARSFCYNMNAFDCLQLPLSRSRPEGHAFSRDICTIES